MHGWRYQHTLSQFARQLENRVAHMAAGGFVQKEILSPAGSDGEGLGTYHIVDGVRENAGGVYHSPGLDLF